VVNYRGNSERSGTITAEMRTGATVYHSTGKYTDEHRSLMNTLAAYKLNR